MNNATPTAGLKIYLPSATDQGGLAEMRLFHLPKRTSLPATLTSATFAVEIANGTKTAQIRFLSGNKDMVPLAADLVSIDFHQPFPDERPAKILRLGWLTCSKYTSRCTFMLSDLRDQAKEAKAINDAP
jgi:hypothetical protein